MTVDFPSAPHPACISLPAQRLFYRRNEARAIFRSLFVAVAAVVATFGISTPAGAALTDLGNTTIDTNTGLEWLDLTQTVGMSYNQVSQQLGPGGTFAGYRYATLPEIEGFLTSAGGTAPFLASTRLPLNGWVTDMRILWGTTNGNPGNTYSEAIWGSPAVSTWTEDVWDPETNTFQPVEVTGERVQTGILQDWYDAGYATARFGVGEYNTQTVDYTSSRLGSALVKGENTVARDLWRLAAGGGIGSIADNLDAGGLNRGTYVISGTSLAVFPNTNTQTTINGSGYARVLLEASSSNFATFTFASPVRAIGYDVNPQNFNLGAVVSLEIDGQPAGTYALPASDVNGFRGFVSPVPFTSFTIRTNAQEAWHGIDNLEAFPANLTPTPTLDIKLTITPAEAPGTGYNLEWDSQLGKLYNLRTSTDLSGAISTWTLIEGDIVATSPTNVKNVPEDGPRRFYAVEEFDAP